MVEAQGFNFLFEEPGVGQVISYQIRGLDEHEIPKWAEFCASVFSYKPNPPAASYFSRHYYNDPDRNASLVRVATIDGEIVASCRLFLRKISAGILQENEATTSTTQVMAGGIGEVCTSPTHRKRGLSKALLQNVIDIMRERKIQVSLLHASPAFFPVYEKAAGFQCTVSKWSILEVSSKELLLKAGQESLLNQRQMRVRKAQFPNDTTELQDLHIAYSQRRFAGCIHRTENYWNQYLSQELGNSLWVLENGHGSIVSWLALRDRGGRLQLREYGHDTNSQSIPEENAFTALISAAVGDLRGSGAWQLAIPSGLTLETDRLSFVEASTITEEIDEGWMYLVLDSTLSIRQFSGHDLPHLIWPSDSF